MGLTSDLTISEMSLEECSKYFRPNYCGGLHKSWSICFLQPSLLNQKSQSAELQGQTPSH